MSSEWKEYEFDVTGSTLKAKVEYLTVNHQPADLKADLLVFLYLKQTNTTAPLVFSKSATIKVSSSGAKLTNNRSFVNSDFLSVPSTGEWYKVGIAILQEFTYSEKKNWLGTVIGTTCTPTITISGSVGNINVYDSRKLNLESLPKKDERKRSILESISDDKTISETVDFKIKKQYSNTIHRISCYWGQAKEDFSCFFTNSNCSASVQTSREDDWATNFDETTLYINLSKGNYDNLSRANQLINKNWDYCVIVLESYVGLAKTYLGNSVLHLHFRVDDKYEPSISTYLLEKINTNTIVADWNIPLQGYSKVKATCTGQQSIEGDNAQIAGYEISFDNGDYSDSNELVTNIFQTAGNKTFRFRAFDSRGRSAERTKSLNIYQYFSPEVSFDKLYRCDENGNKADMGEYLFVKPLSLFASCDGKNTVEIKCAWKKVNETAFTEENFADVSSDGTIIAAQLSDISSYDVVLFIRDQLKEGTGTQKPLASGKVLLHFNVGGHSMGIGMYNYAPNTCKVGYDFLLGETDIGDYIKEIVPRADYIVETDTTSDGWTYRKWNSGIAELWGKHTVNWTAINTSQIGKGTYNGVSISMINYYGDVEIPYPDNFFKTVKHVSALGDWTANINLVSSWLSNSKAQFNVRYGSEIPENSPKQLTLSVYAIGTWK